MPSLAICHKIAAEHWGEGLGLSVANALFRLVQFAVKARRANFEALDPLASAERSFVTRYELSFLRMLHHMRRDETRKAREAVTYVTGSTMAPDVIRSGLSFALRFSFGLAKGATGAHPGPHPCDRSSCAQRWLVEKDRRADHVLVALNPRGANSRQRS